MNEPIIVACDNITSIDFKLLERDYIKKKSSMFPNPVKPLKN